MTYEFEKYVASQTIYLYNQVLSLNFYSVIWAGKSVFVVLNTITEKIIDIYGAQLETNETIELENIINDFRNNASFN